MNNYFYLRNKKSSKMILLIVAHSIACQLLRQRQQKKGNSITLNADTQILQLLDNNTNFMYN